MPVVRVKPAGKATRGKKGVDKEGEKTATGKGQGKGKKKVKDKDIHETPECKEYMAADRAVTPIPADKKDKSPRSIPKTHLSHLVRPNVFAYHHINFCVLLLALSLPHDPISNLWYTGFNHMTFMWAELLFIDLTWAQEDEQNAEHPDRKRNTMLGRVRWDGLVAVIASEEQLSNNDDAHELVFTMAERTLLSLYPQDGYQNQSWWSTRQKDNSTNGIEGGEENAGLQGEGLQVGETQLGRGGEVEDVDWEEMQMEEEGVKGARGDQAREVSAEGKIGDIAAEDDEGGEQQRGTERKPTPLRRVDKGDEDKSEADEGEEEETSLGWPSRTFKSIQWLVVQANAFWESFPHRWKNYYTDGKTKDVLTPGQMMRMFERTNFGDNGLNYLGHVDKSLQHVLAVFIEVFEEGPLDTKTGWWSDRGKLLEWELKPETRFTMARMLFGMGCMQHHPENMDVIMSSLKEPYETLLKAQESRFAARIHRQVKRLQENVVPYREAYLALTILARLASDPAIGLAAYTSEMRLKEAVKSFIDTGIMHSSRMETSYRWSREWYNKDTNVPEHEKDMKSQSSEWNLYFLGDKACPQPFDIVLKQRRAKISRALLKLILPLTMREMVLVLKRLDAANVSLDLQMLAFHETFFVNATKHVGRWITRHPSVKKGELGLSLAWDFFRYSASHFSVVSSAVGSLITWQSSSLLEPYATEATRSEIRAVAATAVQDHAAEVLAPLRLYDSGTRTLGLSTSQISNKLIATMMGLDLSQT
ncbi:hypothetical protein QFC21_005593, partial [Naganishia friedmannii]